MLQLHNRVWILSPDEATQRNFKTVSRSFARYIHSLLFDLDSVIHWDSKEDLKDDPSLITCAPEYFV